MLHPDVTLAHIDERIGRGLFATAFIPRGTLLWVLDPLDRVMSPAEVAGMPAAVQPLIEKYSYVDPRGDYVLCWDEARYMNHACDAVSRAVGEAMEIAVRDVQPGDQITCEYGTLNIESGFPCACGAASCRGELRPDDMDRHWQAWDAEAAAAWPLAPGVPQPLLPYVKAGPADQPLLAFLRGGPYAPPPSVRAFAYPRRA